jgi:hypothetical protein
MGSDEPPSGTFSSVTFDELVQRAKEKADEKKEIEVCVKC